MSKWIDRLKLGKYAPLQMFFSEFYSAIKDKNDDLHHCPSEQQKSMRAIYYHACAISNSLNGFQKTKCSDTKDMHHTTLNTSTQKLREYIDSLQPDENHGHHNKNIEHLKTAYSKFEREFNLRKKDIDADLQVAKDLKELSQLR